MSSEWELDDGIKSIKSAWRREHTARENLGRMLENAEVENAKLRELVADMWRAIVHEYPRGGFTDMGRFERRVRDMGLEVE